MPAGKPAYQRHRPEQTPLYQLVQQHAQTFMAQSAAAGAALPRFVEEEFAAYLACGILAHGFLRLTCDTCKRDTLVAFSCKRRGICPACGTRRMNEAAAYLVDEIIPRVPVRQWVLSFPIPLRSRFAVHPELLTPVLAVVQRAIATHLIQQAGSRRADAVTGAVTLIQRFGSAANLNIHLHGLWLDGVYQTAGEAGEGEPVFQEAVPPTAEQLQTLLDTIIKRILRHLTRAGHLIEEEGEVYLANTDPDNVLAPLQAASATWRIAHGPRAGRKVLRLYEGQSTMFTHGKTVLCVNAHGFSLHAGVRCEAHDRQSLEQLCRYITRPAISNERLAINGKGQVVLKLKTPWKDGATHLIMAPLEFMQRLAALVPRPRLHLTRFHGVLAPNAKLRSQIVRKVEQAVAHPCEHEAAQRTGAHELGAHAQARVRHRHRALRVWRQVEVRGGDRTARSDRENPHALGACRAAPAGCPGAVRGVVRSGVRVSASGFTGGEAGVRATRARSSKERVKSNG